MEAAQAKMAQLIGRVKTSDVYDIEGKEAVAPGITKDQVNQTGVKMRQAARFSMLEAMKQEFAGNDEMQGFLSDEQFVSMAYDAFESGLGDRIQDYLTMWGNRTKAELSQMGIETFQKDSNGNELTPAAIAQAYKLRAQELEKIYNRVETRSAMLAPQFKRAQFLEASRQVKFAQMQSIAKSKQSTSFEMSTIKGMDNQVSTVQTTAAQKYNYLKKQLAILEAQKARMEVVNKTVNPENKSRSIEGGYANSTIEHVDKMIKDHQDMIESMELANKENPQFAKEVASDAATRSAIADEHMDNFHDYLTKEILLQDSYARFRELTDLSLVGKTMQDLKERIEKDNAEKSYQDKLQEDDEALSSDFRSRLNSAGYQDLVQSSVDEGGINGAPDTTRLFFFNIEDKDGAKSYRAIRDMRNPKSWYIYDIESGEIVKDKYGKPMLFDRDFYRKNVSKIEFVTREKGNELRERITNQRRRSMQVTALEDLKNDYATTLKQNISRIEANETKIGELEKELDELVKSDEKNVSEIESRIKSLKAEIENMQEEIDILKQYNDQLSYSISALKLLQQNIISNEEYTRVQQMADKLRLQSKEDAEAFKKAALESGRITDEEIRKFEEHEASVIRYIEEKQRIVDEANHYVEELEGYVQSSKDLIELLGKQLTDEFYKKYPDFPRFLEANKLSKDGILNVSEASLESRKGVFNRFIEAEATRRGESVETVREEFRDFVKDLENVDVRMAAQGKSLSELEAKLVTTKAERDAIVAAHKEFLKAMESKITSLQKAELADFIEDNMDAILRKIRNTYYNMRYWGDTTSVDNSQKAGKNDGEVTESEERTPRDPSFESSDIFRKLV